MLPEAKEPRMTDLLDAMTAEQTEAGTELIVAEAQQNAVALFTSDEKYSEFYERVKAQVASFVPDTSTAKGRAEIASVAFRVTKAKTTLDKAGLALTEEWRKQTAAVNASRKKMTTELDALAAEVRRPLTEWEEQDKARAAEADRLIAWMRQAAVVSEEDTAETVERRGRQIHAYDPSPELFQERLDEAAEAKAATIAVLLKARARLHQEELDRAELARLRQEAEEREAKDRAEREKQEQERLAREAEERAAEAARRAKEESDRRIQEAQERAAREAEEKARAEERAKHEAQLAEERAAREKVEREAAEARRKEEERLAWERKEQADRERREADERHRKAVIAEIADDISAVVLADISPKLARSIADAIAAGTIRHVSIRF